jgi:hypothetical protein
MHILRKKDENEVTDIVINENFKISFISKSGVSDAWYRKVQRKFNNHPKKF